VGNNVGGINNESINFSLNYNNPVSDKLLLKIEAENNAEYKVQINSVWGQRIYSEIISSPGSKIFEIPFEHFKPGIYILLISDKNQNQIVRKIMKI
jgi:Tol biopolymer transport system component